MKKYLIPTLAASFLLSSVGSILAAPAQPQKIKSVEFIGMDAPKTDDEKNNLMYSKASVEVTYVNGSKKHFL
ncbi:hypothetical protein ACFQDF_30625 [Ectobacillus funiculus]